MTSTSWWPSATQTSTFLAPHLVAGGAGSARNLAPLLRNELHIDTGRIFLAVDDAVDAAGLISPIAEALESSGYEVIRRGGFGAEPVDEIVDAAAAEARSRDVAAVIGVGGGSVLDSAKLIALLLRNEGGSADWVGPVEPGTEVAPLLLIPTTCGTGSETTNIAMVTVAGNKRSSVCSGFVPPIAVLDPELIASLPPKVVAATGMDALAHAVESLMSTQVSMLSAHASFHAIELLIENLERAVAGDKEALARTLWGAHLGGQSLNAGVVLGHSMAYSFAHATPMPHGVSCALALPYCIAFNQNIDAKLAERIALALTAGKTSSLREAAQEVQDLARRLGLPTTYAEARINPSRSDELASYCATQYPRPTNPEGMDEGRLKVLFSAVETGDLGLAFTATA